MLFVRVVATHVHTHTLTHTHKHTHTHTHTHTVAHTYTHKISSVRYASVHATLHNIPDVKTASEGNKFTLGMPLRCGSDCCQHGCPLYQHQMEAVQTPIWGEKHIIESPDSHDVHNPRDASVECHQQHKRGFNAQFMNSFIGCVLSTVPVFVFNENDTLPVQC